MRPALTHFVLTLALCASFGSSATAQPVPFLDEPVVLRPARSRDGEVESPRTTARPSDDLETISPRAKPVRLGRPTDARPLADDDTLRIDRRLPDRDEKSDVDDFLDRRSPLRDRRNREEERYERRRREERSSGKFGDRIKDLLTPGGRDNWWFSDHAFDQFATPITNPFLAEDPRALTEIRPVFIYQNIPTPQPNFRGGNIYFFGARASIAFSERLSITLNKLGALSVNPSNKPLLDSEFGFAELWLGPKFTFYRDPQFGTILAAGTIFQIPTGPAKVYQDTGNLSIVPYLSAGKTLGEFRELGTFNGILTGGYAFSTNRNRSEYFYLSAHLDFDFRNNHRFYPIAEMNYYQYTRNGNGRAFSGEGHDLFNFGSKAKGASLLTGALGARFKITEAAQIGAAFEIPLFGNKDVFKYRFTTDLIFRY